jgi:demethoxyubiquinone hydroxylase (CLK1/Coq7/Cat5 family)
MQTHSHHHSRAQDAGTDKLRQLLRAEMAAVETYTFSLESNDHVGLLHRTLEAILDSHTHRVDQLRAQIGEFEAEPVMCSGVWGTFAKAFEAGSNLLGNAAALAALEEGEDHLLTLYKEDSLGFDARSHRIIQDRLLPAQRLTHTLSRMLKPT